MGLTWDRIKLDRAVAEITDTKAHQVRLAYLPPDVVSLLQELRLQPDSPKHTGPFATMGNNLNRACGRIVKRAGIAYTVAHDSRRSFATDLARANVSQRVAQSLCGHASMATTGKYYQAVDEKMARAALVRIAG